jgi:undecaprenyl-diphosphatase
MTNWTHRIQRFLRTFSLCFAILSIIALPALAQIPAPESPATSSAPAASSAPAPAAARENIPAATAPAIPTTQPSEASANPSRAHMSLTQAAIIGVVEGVTEYLPVSSTGHIILTQRAMGIGTESQDSKEAADAFAICVQAGAILAVLGLYFARVKQGVRGLLGQDPVGLRLSINLIIAFIPALIAGALFSKKIKEYIFDLRFISIAWFVGGLAILYIAWRNTRPDPKQPTAQVPPAEKGFALDVLNWQSALLIGLAQCIAMWPGTSRSLVTIVAGVLVGMSLSAAVEFSFLLGVITLTAATVKDLKDHGRLMLDAYGALTLFVGFFAAFVSAVAAIEWLVSFLKKHSMAVFGYYRIALALVVAALLLAKILHP